MSLYRPGLGLDPCRSATASGRRTAAPAGQLWPCTDDMDKPALPRPSSHTSDSDKDAGYKAPIGADAEASDGW